MKAINKHSYFVGFLWFTSLTLGSVAGLAQTVATPEIASTEKLEVTEGEYQKKLPSYRERLSAQNLARTIRLAVPNPRGEILGEYYTEPKNSREPAIRKHTVLASSRNGRYFQIDFTPIMKETNPITIYNYVKAKVAWVNDQLGRTEVVSEYEALTYFEHRRWIPLRIGSMLENRDIAKLKRVTLPEGLGYLDMPIRFYPKGSAIAHVLGAVKRSKGWPLRAFTEGDELYPPIEGIRGLEKSQDTILHGKPTILEYTYDENGAMRAPIVVDKGRAGLNIILTIDTKLQEIAEGILKKHTARSGSNKGAFVVLDAQTMQIKALASWPMFDPNDFVPVLLPSKQAEWSANKNDPMVGRAFQSAYPPASVFKLATAFIALGSGLVGPNEARYPCLNSITYDGSTMKNWTKEPGQPYMTVGDALKRSCNTWFFQAANELQKNDKYFEKWFHGLIPQLGLGKKTGLGLAEETSGYAYVKDGKPQPFYVGAQVANVAIGQGDLLTSPLQMAQMVGRIANSRLNTKAYLIRGRQDDDGHYVRVTPPIDEDVHLNRYEAVLAELRLGMWDVVYGRSGTGAAAIPVDFSIVGKTGSGQWGKNRSVAWFASYAPFYNGSAEYSAKPKYVVVALQEPNAGQELGGADHAAPMVRDFYQSSYVGKRMREHLNGTTDAPPAEVERGVLRAIPVMPGED